MECRSIGMESRGGVQECKSIGVDSRAGVQEYRGGFQGWNAGVQRWSARVECRSGVPTFDGFAVQPDVHFVRSRLPGNVSGRHRAVTLGTQLARHVL